MVFVEAWPFGTHILKIILTNRYFSYLDIRSTVRIFYWLQIGNLQDRLTKAILILNSCYHRFQSRRTAPCIGLDAQKDQDRPHNRAEDTYQGWAPRLGRPFPGHQKAGYGKGERKCLYSTSSGT